jgi:N-succinyldiaminopimelate aminotransferase
MSALAVRTGAVNLGQGFPDTSGPAAVVDVAVAAMRAGRNQYAPLAGVPPLREAIVEHQRRHYGIDPEDIQVTFGATEALASALLAFVKEGDEVVALDPSYDSYAPVTRQAGGVFRPIALTPPAWRVTKEAIDAAVTDRTRVLLLNSPHNPTGRVLDATELELLATTCRERDLIAVTDEVYEHLVYDGRHIPIATLAGMDERTVTISSLGKTHSLTGWKIGWASGPADLIARVRGVKQFLSFAGGTPLQHAAAVGLGIAADELVAELRVKRDRLAEALAGCGFDVMPSAGTYFLNADVHEDAADLCMRLPHEAGVVAIPLSAFSTQALDTIVRFTFCKSDAVIDEGIRRLLAWRSV